MGVGAQSHLHPPPMHSRLLSFLSDFERSLQADDPSPDEGNWQTSRAVNYRSGLARLQLNVRMPDQNVRPRGSVVLQSYHLADGAACLKAQLTWTGTEPTVVHSIFAKPGCDWKTEARRLAAKWMAGPPVVESVAPAEETEVIVREAAVAVG
jgi:hypothetical protein